MGKMYFVTHLHKAKGGFYLSKHATQYAEGYFFLIRMNLFSTNFGKMHLMQSIIRKKRLISVVENHQQIFTHTMFFL